MVIVCCILSKFFKFLRTAATFICKDNFFVLLSNEDSHISTVEIYRYINEAIVMRDTMEARKTIVHLLVYLLIGWVVWIIVNFIEKNVACVCSWSLLLSGICQVHI